MGNPIILVATRKVLWHSADSHDLGIGRNVGRAMNHEGGLTQGGLEFVASAGPSARDSHAHCDFFNCKENVSE